MASKCLGLFFVIMIALVSALLYLDTPLKWISFVLLMGFVIQFVLSQIFLRGQEPIKPISLNFPNKVHREKLQKELAMAMQVQQGLLDIAVPHMEGLLIAKRCQPAASVGGDFFGFIEVKKGLEEAEASVGVHRFSDQDHARLGVVIGDVAGHGLSSALIMALSAGMIDEIAKRHLEPAKVLEQANKDLFRYIQDTEVSHVSASYAVLDRKTLCLNLARAGHTPLYILRKNQSMIEEISTKGVYLGLFDGVDFEEQNVRLQLGDRLIFFTDGVIESRNPKGELFGEERLKALLLDQKECPVGHALDTLFDALVLFRESSQQRDDCSVVMIDII